MSGAAPFNRTIQAHVPAQAQAVTGSTVVAIAPYDGRVTKVSYLPATTLTGANSNSRTITLTNKGQGGAGTTKVAEKAFVSGVNAVAFDENEITLDGDEEDLEVAAGDVLAITSTAVSSGLADPGGLIVITIARA